MTNQRTFTPQSMLSALMLATRFLARHVERKESWEVDLKELLDGVNEDVANGVFSQEVVEVLQLLLLDDAPAQLFRSFRE